MNQTVTNMMKWSAIPALLLICMLSRFAAGFEFLVDLAICSGAIVFIRWAVRAKAYYWAAGFVLVAIVSSPLMLAVKIFLLLGLVCTGVFLTTLAVFRPQMARAQ